MSAHFRPWPRMMTRKTAAAYCDLSEAEFEREVNAGRLPMPVRLGNRNHWSSVEIDKSLDAINVKDDWRNGSPLYAA